MNKTNLNMLFIDLVPNFAHLINKTAQTKEEFKNHVKKVYCLSNPKTKLFYLSIEKSIFDTIKLSNDGYLILFNQ